MLRWLKCELRLRSKSCPIFSCCRALSISCCASSYRRETSSLDDETWLLPVLCRSCVVASSSSELYLKTDDACSSGSPICWWNLAVVSCSSELPICCDCKYRRTLDEVHREICGFPSGLPICRGSGIATKPSSLQSLFYNNGNNASTDNITAGVAA